MSPHEVARPGENPRLAKGTEFKTCSLVERGFTAVAT